MIITFTLRFRLRSVTVAGVSRIVLDPGRHAQAPSGYRIIRTLNITEHNGRLSIEMARYAVDLERGAVVAGA